MGLVVDDGLLTFLARDYLERPSWLTLERSGKKCLSRALQDSIAGMSVLGNDNAGAGKVSKFSSFLPSPLGSHPPTSLPRLHVSHVRRPPDTSPEISFVSNGVIYTRVILATP